VVFGLAFLRRGGASECSQEPEPAQHNIRDVRSGELRGMGLRETKNHVKSRYGIKSIDRVPEGKKALDFTFRLCWIMLNYFSTSVFHYLWDDTALGAILKLPLQDADWQTIAGNRDLNIAKSTLDISTDPAIVSLFFFCSLYQNQRTVFDDQKYAWLTRDSNPHRERSDLLVITVEVLKPLTWCIPRFIKILVQQWKLVGFVSCYVGSIRWRICETESTI
jgi:hypothetical protein